MPAKKNIIKELRQEIVDLKLELENNKQTMRGREAWFKRIQNTHQYELESINFQTTTIAKTLQRKFQKDLSWLALTDDADSKFQYIKFVVGSFKAFGRTSRRKPNGR